MEGSFQDKEKEKIRKPLKILIVESNQEIADLVKDILENEDHQVTAFTSKERALEELKRKKEENSPFDWVITNRGFGERLQSKMDGITFAETIRKEKLGNPYITMLSRSAEAYSQKNLKEMGIQHTIGKPFEKGQLIELVSVVRQFRTQPENPQIA
jgi:CheY-like chemotaxis protein